MKVSYKQRKVLQIFSILERGNRVTRITFFQTYLITGFVKNMCYDTLKSFQKSLNDQVRSEIRIPMETGAINIFS